MPRVGLYLYPLFSGKTIAVRVVLVLSLVLGFLFYMYFAPYLNKYYILDPIRESTAKYFVSVDVNPAPYMEEEAYGNATVAIMRCLDGGPYIVTALSTVDIDGVEYAVGVALDNRSIRFMAPDVPEKLFVSHAGSFDGVLIREDTLINTGAVPETATLSISGYTLRLLGTHSRLFLSYARHFILLYNTWKARDIIGRLYIGNVLLSSQEALKKLEKCISEANKTLVSMGIGTVGYTVETKKALYEQNKRAALGTEFYEMMLLASGLSLVVSIIVSIREGLGLASASSELIGVLRLYGAPLYTILLMGLVTGAVIGVGVLAGLLIVSRLVFDLLLPVRLPPIGYTLCSTSGLLLGVFASIVFATGLGFLLFTRRSRLEDLVSSR